MLQKMRIPVTVVIAFVLCMALMLVASPCPDAKASGKIVLNNDEQRFVDLINQARVGRGLEALSVDGDLVTVARAKASGSNASIGSLLNSRGITSCSIGQVTGKTFDVDLVVTALSRAYSKYTLFNPSFNRIGVGVSGNSINKPFALVFVDSGSRASLPKPTPKPQPTPKPEPRPDPRPQPQPGDSTASMTADELQMFNLVNQERERFGLKTYRADMELVKLARLKAKDMIDLGYFSHTSPTYGSPFDMMRSFGVSYVYAGENLAGAPTVGLAHTNLMNSSGHRANILNANFSGIGIGVVEGGPYGKMFVQIFKG